MFPGFHCCEVTSSTKCLRFKGAFDTEFSFTKQFDFANNKKRERKAEGRGRFPSASSGSRLGPVHQGPAPGGRLPAEGPGSGPRGSGPQGVKPTGRSFGFMALRCAAVPNFHVVNAAFQPFQILVGDSWCKILPIFYALIE